MRSIYMIALNTYKEIMRDRILYGLIVFALLLIGFSMALGSLSFAEQSRISVNFGFTGIHISVAILSMFVGATLVSKEIDKKTIMTILVRPISRIQFLLGKSLGLTAISLTIIIGLSAVMLGVFKTMGVELNMSFFLGLYGIALESIVLLGVSLFFSSFTRPMLVVSFSIGVFFIGHSLESLQFFAGKSKDAGFQMLSQGLSIIIPDLEKFNWRSLFIYGDVVELDTFAYTTAYSLCWFGFLICMTGLVLRRKDFG